MQPKMLCEIFIELIARQFDLAVQYNTPQNSDQRIS